MKSATSVEVSTPLCKCAMPRPRRLGAELCCVGCGARLIGDIPALTLRTVDGDNGAYIPPRSRVELLEYREAAEDPYYVVAYDGMEFRVRPGNLEMIA